MFQNSVQEFDAVHDRSTAVVIGSQLVFKDGSSRTNTRYISDVVMHDPLDDDEGRRIRWENRFARSKLLVQKAYDQFIDLKQRLLNENAASRAQGFGPPPPDGLSQLKQLKAA